VDCTVDDICQPEFGV